MSIEKQKKILTIINVVLMVGTVVTLAITSSHHSYLLTVTQNPTYLKAK